MEIVKIWLNCVECYSRGNKMRMHIASCGTHNYLIFKTAQHVEWKATSVLLCLGNCIIALTILIWTSDYWGHLKWWPLLEWLISIRFDGHEPYKSPKWLSRLTNCVCMVCNRTIGRKMQNKLFLSNLDEILTIWKHRDDYSKGVVMGWTWTFVEGHTLFVDRKPFR
jgi:hypothetical protein